MSREAHRREAQEIISRLQSEYRLEAQQFADRWKEKCRLGRAAIQASAQRHGVNATAVLRPPPLASGNLIADPG